MKKKSKTSSPGTHPAIRKPAPSGKKLRLDRLLVDHGLVETRERGHALILAGQVLVNGQKMEKAGALVSDDAEIRIIGEMPPYVSRGGLKLAAALNEFKLDVSGKTALDVGASTGGFTDCLLQHGAKRVYAVDVGYGQMAWKLRQDTRVVLRERVNIREMDSSLIPEPVDMAVIDVSFISLEKVVPAVLKFVRHEAEIIALIKPQFEAGRELVGKGGVVRDEAVRLASVEKVKNFLLGIGMEVKGTIPSPISGREGNVEFLVYAVNRR